MAERLSAVCITGGSGALGRRLAARLAASGVSRVIAYDREAGTPRANVISITGDILSANDMVSAFKGCEAVFHLAALIHAGKSANDAERYREVNVEGTRRVAEACKRAGVSRIVHASTSHVYGLPQKLPVSENHPTRPLSIYAQSKLDAEGVLRESQVASVAARLANLYGGGIGPETVIGRALSQAASGEPIRLRNLSEARDFVHIDDAAEALIRLALLPPEKFRAVNVSTGKAVLLSDMAEALARLAGVSVAPPEQKSPGDMPEFVLDKTLLEKLTGWSPSIGLEEGLKRALQEARPAHTA